MQIYDPIAYIFLFINNFCVQTFLGGNGLGGTLAYF